MQDYLSVLLLAAMPVSELRGAIPAALVSFHWSPLQSYIFSVAGNLVPVAILLWFMPRFYDFFAARISLVRRASDWYFGKLEARHAARFRKWGPLALLFFVAIPLPLTGAWSGAILAFLFRIPFWQAFVMISGGVLVAGVLVLGGSIGILNLF